MAKEVVKVSPETREAYEAPKCEVMELQMEGVLCASGPNGSGLEPGKDDGNVDWGDGYSVNDRRRR